MPDWTSAYVLVGGARFHYWRSGGSGIPLVLAHGFSDSGACWKPIARQLADRYDVILPDARGHGLSDRLSIGHPMDMGKDLADLITTLELSAVALGGHSMGASSALSAAALCPERVSVLVLEDPPWRSPNAPRDPAWANWLKSVLSKSPAEVAEMIRAESPHWSDEDVRTLAEAKVQLDPAILDAPPLGSRPWQDLLPKLRCPGLIITADPALGGIVTPEIARHAGALWPAGRFANIAGAGHGIHRDRPAAFVSAVTGFLAEHLG
jgi:N-formylmaleamate deformylase